MEVADLLARSPATLYRDAGRVEPDPERGWQGRAVGRWREYTVEASDLHPPYVVALERRAGVRVESSGPADRDVTVTLAAFFDNSLREDGTRPPPVPVRVLLNGTVIGEIACGVGLEEHVVHAPKRAWLRGRNVIEFELDELVDSPWGDRWASHSPRSTWGRRARSRSTSTSVASPSHRGARSPTASRCRAPPRSTRRGPRADAARCASRRCGSTR
ncbi:MAG: hypothetical protein R3F34_00215 [Planctomycetota bacterium]